MKLFKVWFNMIPFLLNPKLQRSCLFVIILYFLSIIHIHYLVKCKKYKKKRYKKVSDWLKIFAYTIPSPSIYQVSQRKENCTYYIEMHN